MPLAAPREITVWLRANNELTLPEAIAKQLGVQPGDQLLVTIDDHEPGIVHVRPLLRSYAGVAAGSYGTPEEVAEYLKNERASWGE